MVKKPFLAIGELSKRVPLVVLDIGYSSRNKSCGVAWTGGAGPKNFRFGEAIEVVAKQLSDNDAAAFVIEAPLSTYHNESGNPEIRGEFEKGRGWYWGPGALCTIAAQRFLERLAPKLRRGRRVLLAEAFLSNKPQRTDHRADAALILRRFRSIKPCSVRGGLEPLLSIIEGVPEVRVFRGTVVSA